MYLPLQYLSWHYRYGLLHLFSITKELVRFTYSLFSIGLFFRTLFKPMFSIETSTRDVELVPDIISLIVSNVVLRALGFFFRACLIVAGVTSIIFVILSMTVIILLWTFFPLFFVISFYFSLILIGKIL